MAKLTTVREKPEDKGFIEDKELLQDVNNKLIELKDSLDSVNETKQEIELKTTLLLDNLETNINSKIGEIELKTKQLLDDKADLELVLNTIDEKVENINEKFLIFEDVIVGFKNITEQNKTEFSNTLLNSNNKIKELEKQISKPNDFVNEEKVLSLLKELKDGLNSKLEEELKLIKSIHIDKQEAKPRQMHSLANIASPAIVEKTIMPGAIRFDLDRQVLRICTNKGWRDY